MVFQNVCIYAGSSLGDKGSRFRKGITITQDQCTHKIKTSEVTISTRIYNELQITTGRRDVPLKTKEKQYI